MSACRCGCTSLGLSTLDFTVRCSGCGLPTFGEDRSARTPASVALTTFAATFSSKSPVATEMWVQEFLSISSEDAPIVAAPMSRKTMGALDRASTNQGQNVDVSGNV